MLTKAYLMRVVLVLYLAVCAMMLVFAASEDGSGIYFVGRIFSLFLSLPWCLVADRYGIPEGSSESYYFYIGGMLINAGILLAIPVGYEMWGKAKRDRS